MASKKFELNVYNADGTHIEEVFGSLKERNARVKSLNLNGYDSYGYVSHIKDRQNPFVDAVVVNYLFFEDNREVA